MKRSLFFLLITELLLVYCVQAQSEEETKRLDRQLQFSQPDTNRIKRLLELGKNDLRPTYTQVANRSKAIAFFRQAEAISKRIDNQKWTEESQCLIGIGYLLSHDWSRGKAYFMNVIEARHRRGDIAGELKALLRLVTTTYCDDCRENMSLLNRALALAHQLGDTGQEMLILMEMGYEYFQLENGDTKQAERKARQVLALQETVGVEPLIQAYHGLAEESVYKLPGEYGYLSNAYYFMSDLSQAKGDLNQKLFFILKVVKSVESLGLSEELDYAYFKLGNAYYELGQYDKSIIYHKKSLAISRQKGKPFIQVGLISRMVVTLLKQKKATVALHLLQDITHKNMLITYDDKLLIAQSLGACYNALNQYKLAEQNYLESVALSKLVASQFQYAVWQQICQFYISNGQYAQAELYLKRLLKAPQKKIIPSHQLAVQLMLFKVDSAQGHYQEAIKHYQRYMALNDSIFSEKKSRQIAQLSIQYETDRKEQQLRLKEQNIALLTEQHHVQQTQRNALIGGTILLLLMVGLFYNRYRLKQHSNQRLEDKQVLIDQKNQSLQQVVEEKDNLLEEKEQLLEEREWMLKEIHHRVKNNLQVISSMLRSQIEFLQEPTALDALRESQNRVQVMALIHQKLYQSDNLARIGMRDYIHQIVEYLIESFDRKQTVKASLAIADVALDVSLATPLGLIINEAVTNSLKYAFPKNRKGTVAVSLVALDEQIYRLTMSDDGIGLPADFDVACSNTLGLTMIRGLSRQIEGELSINQTNGVEINLDFPFH